jgi:hypothetical protein
MECYYIDLFLTNDLFLRLARDEALRNEALRNEGVCDEGEGDEGEGGGAIFGVYEKENNSDLPLSSCISGVFCLRELAGPSLFTEDTLRVR